jgi:Neuraminidase (sialidase)
MNREQVTLTLILALALGSLAVSANDMTEQTLFQQNENGYKNIRIPTLCKTAQGTLLAFAEGREAGDAGKIDTIMRRSEDGGKTWGTQQVIWTMHYSLQCARLPFCVFHGRKTAKAESSSLIRLRRGEARALSG